MTPNPYSASVAFARTFVSDPFANAQHPYVVDLDRIVTNTIKEAGIMSAVKALASKDKQARFEQNANIWNHGPAGEMPVDDLKGLGLTDD